MTSTTKTTELSLSVLLRIGGGDDAYNTNIILCDNYDNTYECLFRFLDIEIKFRRR